MNYRSFSKAYISYFILARIFSNMYFWILWLNFLLCIWWHGTIWLVKLSGCYHGFFMPVLGLFALISFLRQLSAVCRGHSQTPSQLGSPQDWPPWSIWGQTKRKVRILLPLPSHQCSILWCIHASGFSASGPLGSRFHWATLALRLKQHPLLLLTLQPRVLAASVCRQLTGQPPPSITRVTTPCTNYPALWIISFYCAVWYLT